MLRIRKRLDMAAVIKGKHIEQGRVPKTRTIENTNIFGPARGRKVVEGVKRGRGARRRKGRLDTRIW